MPLHLFLCVFCFFILCGKTATADSCRAYPPEIVPHMGPERFQGDFAFCYGMTATKAIEQVSCRMRGRSCKYPRDQVSVANVLLNYGEGEFIEFGHANQAIIETVTKGHVALESCSKYNSVFGDSKSEQLESILAMSRIYSKGLKQGRIKVSDCEDDLLFLQKIHDLKQTSLEILKTVIESKGDWTNTITNLKNIDNCSDQLELSNKIGFQVIDFKKPLTTPEIEGYIESGLAMHSPVIWNFCADQGTNISQCEVKHSALIIGTQKVCCPNSSNPSQLICERNYVIDDSDPSLSRARGPRYRLSLGEIVRKTLNYGEHKVIHPDNDGRHLFDSHGQFMFLYPK